MIFEGFHILRRDTPRTISANILIHTYIHNYYLYTYIKTINITIEDVQKSHNLEWRFASGIAGANIRGVDSPHQPAQCLVDEVAVVPRARGLGRRHPSKAWVHCSRRHHAIELLTSLAKIAPCLAKSSHFSCVRLFKRSPYSSVMTMSRDATHSVVPSMSKAWPATCQHMASTIGAMNCQLRDCVLHGYQSGLLGCAQSQTHQAHGYLPIDIHTGSYALAQYSQDYCSATSCKSMKRANTTQHHSNDIPKHCAQHWRRY